MLNLLQKRDLRVTLTGNQGNSTSQHQQGDASNAGHGNVDPRDNRILPSPTQQESQITVNVLRDESQAFGSQNLGDVTSISINLDNITSSGITNGSNNEIIRNFNSQADALKNKIESQKKLLKYLNYAAPFFTICAILIGIGTNMDYGYDKMSAFDSLSGKKGINTGLEGGGSFTDDYRGINYGLAIFGFSIPIVGAFVSILGIIKTNKKIKKSQKRIKIFEKAKTGIVLDPEKKYSKEVTKAIENYKNNPNPKISKATYTQLIENLVRRAHGPGKY
jgi:hypothetical protein